MSKEPNKCKGILWRGRVNMYMNGSNEINVNRKLYPLKKHEHGCRGCEDCEWLFDHMAEDISGYGHEPEGMDKIEDMGLYRIKVGHATRDYETGYWEIEYMEVVKADVPTT